MKEDIYIRILKLGKEKGLRGLSRDEFRDFIHKNGYLTNDELKKIKESPKEYSGEIKEKSSLISGLFNEVFNTPSWLEDDKQKMSIDSYFKLLEYEELVDARKTAKSARRFSVVAIVISLVAIFVSSGIAIYQTIVPSKMDSEQIKELKYNGSSIASKLNIIIENNTNQIKELKRINKNLTRQSSGPSSPSNGTGSSAGR